MDGRFGRRDCRAEDKNNRSFLQGAVETRCLAASSLPEIQAKSHATSFMLLPSKKRSTNGRSIPCAKAAMALSSTARFAATPQDSLVHNGLHLRSSSRRSA